MRCLLLIAVTKHLATCLQARADACSRIKNVIVWEFRLSWRRSLSWCEVGFCAVVSLLKRSQMKLTTPGQLSLAVIENEGIFFNFVTISLVHFWCRGFSIATKLCVFSLCFFWARKKTHFSVRFCFVLVNVLFVIANGRGEMGWDKYHSRCKLGAVLLLTWKWRTVKMSTVFVLLFCKGQKQ